jgi:hypothetical protein
VPGPTTLCLVGGRFQVEATFDDAGGGFAGAAQGVLLTDDSAYLWFFNPANLEAVVKVLDGCAVNNHFWVFVGGLTNLHAVFRVTDTHTGLQRLYVNPQGSAFQSAQDIGAFSCP